MQHTSAPSCTLFAKVTVKQHPYSQQPISILITAAMYPNFTASKALYFTELPLQVTTIACIQNAIARLQKQANAADVSVKVQPKVSKHIVAVA
jgi:hypothetical protein